MKRTIKIALLLVALIAAGVVSVWVLGLTKGTRWSAGAPSQARRVNVAAPPSRVAPVTAGAATTAAVPVPESVRSIVAETALTPYPDRVKFIRTLPEELTAEEAQAFSAYLLVPASSGEEDRQQENWLRNEMMDKLVESPALPAGLVQMLVAIYQDAKQDIVMRDYAVQHMTPVYSRATEEEKAMLQQTLWQAAEETDTSIAGTALLALRDLAQDHREFESGRLSGLALKLAGDERCGELSRITAVQVCGRMGLGQAASLMLELVQKPDSIPLQIAAIAALGDVGNEGARNLLRELAIRPDPRLQPALQTALKKLNQRLGI